MLAGLAFCGMLSQYPRSASQRLCGGHQRRSAAVCDPNPPCPFAQHRENPNPQKCPGECCEECWEKRTAGGTAGSSAVSLLFQRKWTPSTAPGSPPALFPGTLPSTFPGTFGDLGFLSPVAGGLDSNSRASTCEICQNEGHEKTTKKAPTLFSKQTRATKKFTATRKV